MNLPSLHHLMQCFRQLLFLVALPTVVALAPARAEAAECRGYVSECDGMWLLDGKKIPFKRGDKVYDGSVISIDREWAKENPGDGKLSLVLFDGSAPELSTAKGTLDQQLKISAGDPREAGFWERFSREMGNALSRAKKEESYVMMSVRSNKLQLREAVLRLEKGGMDLSPIFRALPTGKYRLRMRPSTSAVADAQTLVFDWRNEKNAKPSALGNHTPGLWVITPLHAQRDEPIGPDTLVLVSAPDTFPSLSEDFSKVIKLTESWREPNYQEDVRSFQRIALAALAKPATPP